MLDYIVGQLEDSGQKVEPGNVEIVSGKKTNYINIEDKGILFLIDQYYPAKRTSAGMVPRIPHLFTWARYQGKTDNGMVFLKDGKTYFRSAAEDKSWKKFEKSLKQYNQGGRKYQLIEGFDPMQRMIMLRPEEIFAMKQVDPSKPNFIQYYQPDTLQTGGRLDEKIITYHFAPAELDYSHQTKSEQNHGFKPKNKPSEILHIWDRCWDFEDFGYKDHRLRPKKSHSAR